MTEFVPFTKIPRLTRECVITEKLDGTNASVTITPEMEVIAGSRTRFVTPTDDNYGFAKWVEAHKMDLLALGIGTHFGEWYGQGINRNYGLTEKRFALFNVARWAASEVRPACCEVVPTLYTGPFMTDRVERLVEQLQENGSVAVPGFMNPEGVVVYHTAAKQLFKKTIEKDEEWKGKAAA